MSDNSVIEEIKAKLDIVQVVSDYLQLRKAGINFKAPCPFHHETEPSFFVSPERQSWHCFGCGEGGDIFSFVMKMEGLEFPDALRQLAKKAGVTLKDRDAGADRDRQRLIEANRMAARYFHEVLMRSSQAEQARAYAARRGLKEDTLEDFMLGYSPDTWDSLLNFLRKKEFRDDEIFRAGLVSKSDRGGYYDRFRGRFMFPIRDRQGNYVGFTSRIMPGPDGKDPPKEAKYVNTTQTPVYNKSSVLFALDKAKQEIRRQGLAVIVEGNMDAISSHQAGVRNVVASSGTAFTAEQLGLLRKLTDRLVLSFDMDAAGELAARRSIDAAVAAGFELRVLRLPKDAGKDPDDCIRKDPAIWVKAIQDAVPYMDWYIAIARSRLKPNDPYAKRKAADELLSELAKMANPVERSHWLKEISEMFQTPESTLLDELNKKMRHGPLPAAKPAAPAAVAPAAKPAQPRVRDREQVASEYVLGMAFNWPNLAQAVIDGVKPEYLPDDLQPLYTGFVVAYNEQRSGGPNIGPGKSLSVSYGDPKTAETIAILSLLAEKEFGELPEQERGQALAKLIGELKKLHISRRQRELTAAMAQAERAGDDAQIEEIRRQVNELIL